VQLLRPARFSADGVRRQLEQLSGSVPDDETVRRTAERSSGVPFLVEELLAAEDLDRAAVRVGRDLYAHRVTGLSAHARSLVDAAALGRDPLDADLLFEASGLPNEEFDAAAREAVSAGVLEHADDGSYRFRHALLREATSLEVPPRRRHALHRRWAEAASSHPGGPGARSADLAEHWAGAGADARALAAYARAADDAARVFAHRERYRLLLQAITLWDRVPDAEGATGTDLGTLLADAGELAQLFGEHATVRELVARGRQLFRRPEDRPRQAWFDVLDLWRRSAADESIPLVEVRASVQAVRAQPPGAQPVRALFMLSNSLLQDGRADEALPVAEEAHTIADSLGEASLQTEALGHLALVHAARDDHDQARRWAEAELARAEALGDLLLVQGALTTLAVVHWEAGDPAASMQASERGREILGGSRPGPLPNEWAMHTLNSVEGLLDLGQWDEARARLDEVAIAGPGSRSLAGWRERLGRWLAVVRGEVTLENLDLGPPQEREHREVQDAYVTVMSLVDVLMHLGAHDEARAIAGSVLWQDRMEHSIPAFVWPVLAVVSRVEVEAAEAGEVVDVTVLERVAALSAVVPAPNDGLQAHAAQVRADLVWAQGSPDPALCRDCAQRWERLGLPYWHAWALLRLARLAAAAGERDEASTSLGAAREIATRLGAEALDGRIRATAAAYGVRLGARARAGQDPGGLTPREREVLALLGEGASNRGIAGRLVISEKTVSVHVSNLLAKLGASSRGEAVAVARRAGILGAESHHA
jgi:DNA-binding CsgD family transcriptional regulator